MRLHCCDSDHNCLDNSQLVKMLTLGDSTVMRRRWATLQKKGSEYLAMRAARHIYTQLLSRYIILLLVDIVRNVATLQAT